MITATMCFRLLCKARSKIVADFGSACPFAGFAKLHWVELELGAGDPRCRLRLIIDGYKQTTSLHFDVWSPSGRNQSELRVCGGAGRAMASGLGCVKHAVPGRALNAPMNRLTLTGKIPAGTRRIRIVTIPEIYWERDPH